MWLIPSWAIGVAIIIVVASIPKTVRLLIQSRANRTSPSGLSDAELSQIRDGLEDMQRRLGDLEERVDFTERLLAKQREGGVGGGGGERLAPPRTG